MPNARERPIASPISNGTRDELSSPDSKPRLDPPGPATTDLMGMQLSQLHAEDLLNHISRNVEQGRGGWIVTANLDILLRFHREPEARQLYSAADLTVADGAPLVWAARLQGHPLPERIAGASFALSLVERCAARNYNVFLLGGAPGSAERAASVLEARHKGLTVSADSSPRISLPPKLPEINAVLERLRKERPLIVLVGLGSPKQEYLIEALRREWPQTWFVGVGVTFSFIAGDLNRAPVVLQRVGLEWLHRLSQEPQRLAKRYLVDDIPFLFKLLTVSLGRRLTR